MAIITPGRMKNRPGYFRRSLRKYIRKGQIVAAAWPPLRGPHRLTWQIANVERIKAAVKLIKVTSARETTTIREALARFLSKHRGLKGSSAIRERDWLTANLTGRSWTLTLPDGRKVHSAAVVRDMSDFLDTMEPRVGSLFTRGQHGWRTTVQCKPGAVFSMGVPGSVPNCCPESSIPDASQAVGGYPPDKTHIGLFEQPDVPVDIPRFWRCVFTENNGGIRVNLAEMQYRDTPGGVDKAVGGTASASSQNTSSTGPEKAFDDDAVSRWVSTSGDWPGAWLAYGFPEPIEVVQFTIRYLQSPPASSAVNAPKAWLLQSSVDGVTWQTVAEYTDQADWSFGELRTFNVP